jgi:putative heme-binding domain-containing protein
MKGDAKAGAAVFRNNSGGPNCIGCHQIGDEGRQVGPPLTTIANKLSREQFFESILTPSAAILMSFELWIVRLKDGDIKTGIKTEENDDHVTLKDNNGEYVDIPLSKIAEQKQSALSMMPDDITKTMSVQDLVNVVEYLSQQKIGASMRTAAALVVVLLSQEKVVLEEKFAGKPGAGWTWAREDAGAWKVDGGALQIKALPARSGTRRRRRRTSSRTSSRPRARPRRRSRSR